MFKRLSSVCLLLLLYSTCLVKANDYTNPLRSEQGGDPDIVFDQGWYYLISTNQVNLAITRSQTLDGLKTGETKVVFQPTDPANSYYVWAPELHQIGGSWHIYYAAGTQGNVDNQRAYVVQGGATPWDTYTFLGQVNTPGWAIDSTRLTVNGKDYFVYSCRRSDTGETLQSLCIAEFTGDAKTIGNEHLISSPTMDWERVQLSVNEGPYAVYNSGKTFLTFSASFCGTNSYAIGLLTYNGGDPLNESSWTKAPPPIYTPANGVYGVGHNSFFQSPDGSELWMTHHSTPNQAGDCDKNRYVNSKKITWNEDGSPNLGQPVPYGQVLPAPAGER